MQNLKDILLLNGYNSLLKTVYRVSKKKKPSYEDWKAITHEAQTRYHSNPQLEKIVIIINYMNLDQSNIGIYMQGLRQFRFIVSISDNTINKTKKNGQHK